MEYKKKEGKTLNKNIRDADAIALKTLITPYKRGKMTCLRNNASVKGRAISRDKRGGVGWGGWEGENDNKDKPQHGYQLFDNLTL